MGRKVKISFETKIDIVHHCMDGKTTVPHEANRLRRSHNRIYEWIALYQAIGTDGLITTSKYTVYSRCSCFVIVNKKKNARIYIM